MAKEGIKPIIVAYLEDRAKNDELFAKAYAKENKSLTVVQSRGVCNENTIHHKRIIELVNNNIHLIKKAI